MGCYECGTEEGMKGGILHYFGGKNIIKKRILSFFPKESYKTYIEPFAGSYAVGMLQQSEIEVYNDLDKNVYSFFKVMSDPESFQQFKRKCDLVYYDNNIYNIFVDELENNHNLSILDRAFYFFICNRMCMKDIAHGNWKMSIWGSHRGLSHHVSSFLSVIDRLPEYHQRLSRLQISNRDALRLLKGCNKENTMIYCDPPYLNRKSKRKYKVDMDMDTQEKFINIVSELNKPNILISGHDNELYDTLGFRKTHIYTDKRTGNKEYLWYNYEPKEEHRNVKP